MMATKYRDKITTLCAKMFAIRSQVHPANQHAVDKYLQTVWKKISTLGNSVVRTTQPESLQDRFKSYVEAEEQRLREGLETVKYDIDAVDTLLLVTGPGRIEKVRRAAALDYTKFNIEIVIESVPSSVAPPPSRLRDLPLVPNHGHPQG